MWDDLVRISCGIEDGDDLRRDVLQALEKAVVGAKITNGVGAGAGVVNGDPGEDGWVAKG